MGGATGGVEGVLPAAANGFNEMRAPVMGLPTGSSRIELGVRVGVDTGAGSTSGLLDGDRAAERAAASPTAPADATTCGDTVIIVGADAKSAIRLLEARLGPVVG